MAPHVEASSLSDITELAGNPPKYPRNPTERTRQPLTLYLARVPGSRDIILTTLKPQLKNVTAEDVAASLYYLHLNTEDDLRLLEDIDCQGTITEEPESVLQKPLPRKPLPESSRSSLDLNHQTKSTANPSFLTSIPKRKPVTSEVSPTDQCQPELKPDLTLPRRPLGPRPFGSEITLPRNILPGVENTRPNTAVNRQDPIPPFNTGSKTGQNFNIVDPVFDDKPSDGFSITLIRRDPSSGAQWNVGTIYGQPVPNGSQHRRGKSSKKPYFDISLHLTTPGYSQFRNASASSHIGEGITEASRPVGVSRTAEISPVQRGSDSSFTRQVRMEGSSFWSRSSTHKRALSDMSGDSASARGRNLSTDSSFDTLSVLGIDRPSKASRDSHAKGYSFSSPWGGSCKFSTGSGGRSLRCKHSLPAPISASKAGDFTSVPGPPSIVSELRFNLPSTTIFSSSTPSEAAGKRPSVDSGHFKFGHIRNKLSPDRILSPHQPPLPPRPHPTSYAAMYPSDEEEPPPLPPRSPTTSHLRPGYQQTTSSETARDSYSDEADDDDRLDLSIGREKAGGGNRGKRAKLGKLIIHDEGLKMLDLAVGANMGIWWSVWESDSR
ncbi:uncharacterized protein PAC_07350 [Phialocephala subalpina]|uniref:Uncharacterized protein n=1 Tax=Phialocephala subalpina TaxID=576137 RepID=A0A1L7WXF4_9HELO|nr:uncharacterized protein PAC_07350 [Phialocephala subalpina]